MHKRYSPHNNYAHMDEAIKLVNNFKVEKVMNYIDKNIKTTEANKAIGIIICKRDNKYVIEFCSDDRIIAREYNLV